MSANCEYTGKARYSRGEAQKAARRSNQRQKSSHGAIRAEFCDRCGDWHLFHPARPIRSGGTGKRGRNQARARWED